MGDTALQDIPLTTQLGAGWEVVRALTPAANLPLVWVSIRRPNHALQNVRLDLDKSMFIDQPTDMPASVRDALRAKAAEVVATIVDGLNV
jgi:hypothetical protein